MFLAVKMNVMHDSFRLHIATILFLFGVANKSWSVMYTLLLVISGHTQSVRLTLILTSSTVRSKYLRSSGSGATSGSPPSRSRLTDPFSE